MQTIETFTGNGTLVSLSPGAVKGFEQRLQGQLIQPGGAGYHKACKIWNGLIDRHPSLIVRCASAADVVAAVNFVRENNLIFSVRSGGHNVSGAELADQGVVSDLSAMRGVPVGEQHRIARAGRRPQCANELA